MIQAWDEGTLKTPVPTYRLYWSLFCLGWFSNFVGSESGQKQRAKLAAEYGLQHNSTPPSQPHTVCIYSTFTMERGEEGGEEVREKVEGQQFTRGV